MIDNPNLFLMLGRKGAGKTAVFINLSRSNNPLYKANDIVFPMSLNNYSWNAHGLLQMNEKSPTLGFRDSWRFIIYVESIRELVKYHEKNHLKIPNKLKKASELLEKLFTKPLPSWSEILGEKLYRLSKLKLPSGGLTEDEIDLSFGEVSFDEISSNQSLKSSLSQNIENLSNLLEDALVECMSDNRIFLLFDRLDEAWDSASMIMCKNIITGLILTADYITSKFKGRIRPIVFLREDIFEDLSMNDKTKLREDCGALLKWDRDSLQKMMLERINHFAAINGEEKVTDINDLFNRKEMRNRNTPFNYILRNTFLRPRDLICFINNVINSMRDSLQEYEVEEDDTSKYSEMKNSKTLYAEHIYLAENKYSEWLLSELKDEWITQKPELDDYIKVIMNNGKTVLSFGDFESKIGEYVTNVDRSKVLEVLSFLFDISIIGFKVGESNIWRYKCNYVSQGFALKDQYKIHYGLTKGLNLTEAYQNE